jgi:hypothetical protein
MTITDSDTEAGAWDVGLSITTEPRGDTDELRI